MIGIASAIGIGGDEYRQPVRLLLALGRIVLHRYTSYSMNAQPLRTSCRVRHASTTSSHIEVLGKSARSRDPCRSDRGCRSTRRVLVVFAILHDLGPNLYEVILIIYHHPPSHALGDPASNPGSESSHDYRRAGPITAGTYNLQPQSKPTVVWRLPRILHIPSQLPLPNAFSTPSGSMPNTPAPFCKYPASVLTPPQFTQTTLSHPTSPPPATFHLPKYHHNTPTGPSC